MDNEKLDILKFNIQRIDGYIEKADNKANFLLVLNVAFIGVLFTNYTKILNFIKQSQSWILLNTFIWLCIIILCIISIIFCILTINPRKSKPKSAYKSVLYYKDITNIKKYKRLLQRKTKNYKTIESEFCVQVVELSKICDKKMDCINKAIFFIKLYGVISIVYSFIYSINYIY